MHAYIYIHYYYYYYYHTIIIYTNRRVFTLVAPSLKGVLSPFTDGYTSFGYGKDYAEPYPFSVKVDRPLSVQDVSVFMSV